MASTIAAPVPQTHPIDRPARKDLANLQLHDEGRSTPLPQYEKTQSVPFNLTLQEDKRNPGQFQLVVNIDPENKPNDGAAPKPAAAKKLYANLQAFPSLGYDVSPLYQTQRSSPPMSPQDEKGWSTLDAIPPDFLQKVVPDWEVTFQRKDSTASTQSRKLSDIKARIKKSGKGFVVRLLKGSGGESSDVAEVCLGQQLAGEVPAAQELDSCPQVELDATETMKATPTHERSDVYEIGSSNEPGIDRSAEPAASARSSTIPDWLRHSTSDAMSRYSMSEEGFSDAETLIQEVRSIDNRLEDDQTDIEPMSIISSMLPTRSASVTSIVKTPTRGLSVVGPVKRINKGDRSRAANYKGKAARSDLNRSDARKSFKHNSSRSPNVSFASGNTMLSQDASSQLRLRPVPALRSQSENWHDSTAEESGTWSHSTQDKRADKSQIHRQSSAEELQKSSKPKSRLRLQTGVSRPKSTNTSPVTSKKRSPRIPKPRSSSSSVQFAEEPQHTPSPVWSEVDSSEELRNALEKAFGTTEDDVTSTQNISSQSAPELEEVTAWGQTGEIPLPPGFEIRSAPINTRSPTLTFWGLAFSALSEHLFEGLHALRLRYGSEPPVPSKHVRVRWTCFCGEPLYDDFIERRPGAARLLEAYLNRPRSHTPTSPAGRTSTSSTMSSVFSSASRASTLATPVSTYGGSSWSKGIDSSKYSPTRLRSSNPFSVRINSFVEEQWLLTCANEGRFTPKIVHLDVNIGKIKSDKDLALALREHYERLNRRWLKWMRLRGLSTIEFVQFEVHRNRFADIRAAPSMPPTSSSTSTKAPSEHPYSFEPVDLVPPVGSTYLLHLFKHPEDYDGELITYLRSPKRRERLEFGMGWGINLVEGFLAQKVWACIMLCFGVGSAVFAILWTLKRGDVQGAFGVAGWVVTLAGLVLGGLQAWLE